VPRSPGDSLLSDTSFMRKPAHHSRDETKMQLAIREFRPIRVLQTSQIRLPFPLFRQRITTFSQKPSSRRRLQVSGCEFSRDIRTRLPTGTSVNGKWACMDFRSISSCISSTFQISEWSCFGL
jgi:hypothetical protein